MTDFEKILRLHRERYPGMEPRDYIKLAYQHSYGIEHLLKNPDFAKEYILDELLSMTMPASPERPEPIGNGLVRYPLSYVESDTEAEVLAKAMLLTAQSFSGSCKAMEYALSVLGSLGDEKLNSAVRDWTACGGAVHHSEGFREKYNPCYRLLKSEYAALIKPAAKIIGLAKNESVFAAIDGCCGSGKTSLAGFVSEIADCNVIHVDDFYLPLSQRDKNWREIPAGNIDLARLRSEVLRPLKEGREVIYRPYRCMTDSWQEPRPMKPKKINIIEGSYSQHPELTGFYNLKIFTTVSPEEQTRRLKAREGDYFSAFREIWIPAEERYFAAFSVENGADMLIENEIKW